MAIPTFVALAVLVVCTAILRPQIRRSADSDGRYKFWTPANTVTTIATVIALVLSLVFLGMWIWDIAHHYPR